MALRTYIDSGVLISALRGEKDISATALAFLNDPLREYVTSDYVKIELLPKCTFHKNHDEKRFYEEFFKGSAIHVPSSNELLELAIDEGGRTGISGIDAIHVACAVVAQAEELITNEKSTRPIHRANGIKVISINP
ncbi:MAG: PIN domain-containing protein [Terriglobia bacterium]|jgi:predicted nucleic acid-binding protein